MAACDHPRRIHLPRLLPAAEHVAGRAASLDSRLLSNLACAFAKGRRLDALKVRARL